jgi:hypothetical protein
LTLRIRDEAIRQEFDHLRDLKFARFGLWLSLIVAVCIMQYLLMADLSSSKGMSFTSLRFCILIVWLIIWGLLNKKFKKWLHYTIYFTKLSMLLTFVFEMRSYSEINDLNLVIDIKYLVVIIPASIINYNTFAFNIFVDPITSLLPYYFVCQG